MLDLGVLHDKWVDGDGVRLASWQAAITWIRVLMGFECVREHGSGVGAGFAALYEMQKAFHCVYMMVE